MVNYCDIAMTCSDIAVECRIPINNNNECTILLKIDIPECALLAIKCNAIIIKMLFVVLLRFC